MVQCVSKEADLHERQVAHVTEDYGDRLRVEGLQRPCNPPQSVCQCPWGLKVPCRNMWCCQPLTISLLSNACFVVDTFTSMQQQVMQVLFHSCIDLPTLSCMNSSYYSNKCIHAFIHWYSSTHSDCHTLVCLPTLPSIHSLTHLDIHLYIHPITLAFNCSFAHSTFVGNVSRMSSWMQTYLA